MEEAMKSWAEAEVERAIKANEECEYITECYKSALKAFKSLEGDGHSGMSIRYTKQMLNRLIDRFPLVDITDEDDNWKEISKCHRSDNIDKHYQCTRYTALFKEVYSDGTVKYHDNNRVSCTSIDRPELSWWHNGFVTQLIHEMFPISMPYFPSTKPIKVYCEEFLSADAKANSSREDFDTLGILYVINICDERIDINRFFKEVPEGWIEINEDEYTSRK